MLAQELPLSCGAACARELLRRGGFIHGEDAVREAASYCVMGIPSLDGIFETGIQEAMNTLGGADWRGGSLPQAFGRIRELIGTAAPMFVMLEAHWVLVEGIIDDDVQILDPKPFAASSHATEARLKLADFAAGFAASKYRVVMQRKP